MRSHKYCSPPIKVALDTIRKTMLVIDKARRARSRDLASIFKNLDNGIPIDSSVKDEENTKVDVKISADLLPYLGVMRVFRKEEDEEEISREVKSTPATPSTEGGNSPFGLSSKPVRTIYNFFSKVKM